MGEVRLTEVPCFEFDVAVKRLYPVDVFAMLRQMAEEGMLQLVPREGKNRRQFSYGDVQFSDDTIYLTVPEAPDGHVVGTIADLIKTPAAPSASASSPHHDPACSDQPSA